MDLALIVIAVLGVALLAVSMYMEWVGLMNLFTPRGPARYPACGHLRMAPTLRPVDRCWGCRHPHLMVVARAPAHRHVH